MASKRRFFATGVAPVSDCNGGKPCRREGLAGMAATKYPRLHSLRCKTRLKKCRELLSMLSGHSDQ